jgi:SAM-dependent methyltransferase
MFNQVLTKCLTNYQQMSCCHNDDRICDCYKCLQPGFYAGGLDKYDCHKKMNFYVLKYGPSYISEIYHSLTTSQLLERFQDNINILSLGCGFSPDYYAILKYILDNNLVLNFRYYGWDISQFWDSTRPPLENIVYQTMDILRPFSFANSQIIMVNKIFSTVYRHNQYTIFLQNLISAITDTMEPNSILVFNDVNNYKTGRDKFDRCIAQLFNNVNVKRYYNSPYANWGNKLKWEYGTGFIRHIQRLFTV